LNPGVGGGGRLLSMWPTEQLANVYGSRFVVTVLFNIVLNY
jgi:hypothetical protein